MLIVLAGVLLVCLAFQPLAFVGLGCFLALLAAAALRPVCTLNLLVATLPLQAVLVLTFRANIKSSELLGCVLVLAVAARCLAWREPIVIERSIALPIFLFLLLTLISTLNTPRFRESMILNQYMDVGVGRDSPDTRSYLTAAWAVYCVFLLFSVTSILRRLPDLFQTLRVLFWTNAAAAVFGVFQWVYLLRNGSLLQLPGSTYHADVVHSTSQGFPRSPGTFTEPSVFANYLVLMLPVTLAIATGSFPQVAKRRTAWLVLSLEVLALLLSFSVSGYVQFVIGLCLFGYLASLRQSKESAVWAVTRRALAGAVGILVVVSVLQFVGVYPADVGEFVAQRLLGEADSAQQRFGLARIAWQMAQDHAVTGVGIGNYPFLAMSYAAEHSVALRQFILPTPSNLFVLFAAELGLPGMLAFGWLMLRVGRALKRGLDRAPAEVRLLHVGLCTAMASTFLSFLFLDNLFVNYFWVLLGLSLALVKVASQPGHQDAVHP